MINHSTESTSNIVRAGGEIFIMQRPSIPAYPLRFDEFLTLQEASEFQATKEKRSIAITIFVSCLLGSISAYMSIDWEKGASFVQAILFVFLVNASVISMLFVSVYHSESKKRSESSRYKNLVENIREAFSSHTNPKN